MTARILSVFLLSAVIVASSIWALPMKLKTQDLKVKLAGELKSKETPTKLHEQEKELEDLAKLQKDKINNAVLQTSSDVKIVQSNGKSQKILKTVNKVVDGNSGKLLSSVKKIRKIGQSNDGKPKIEAETEVDIPAEGIHDTFHDNLFEKDEEPEVKTAAFKKSLPESSAFEESLVNSPEDEIKDLIKSSESIAKYLLETGRFDKLDQSLRDVVRIGLMSKTEASEYKKMVLEYYEKLVELREAEELQSKLNAPPLEYAEQDYALPFNSGGGNQMDNRVYPYGQVEDSNDDRELEQGGRYGDGNEEEAGGYPLDTGLINPQPEYVDISDDTIQRPYNNNNNNRFSVDLKQDLVPMGREEEEEGEEDEERQEGQEVPSDWLTGLLEQANYRGYPEAENMLNTITDSQPTSRAEREKIQQIIESVLARNALKDSEESSEMEREEEPEAEEEEEEEDSREQQEEVDRLRERMRLRNRVSGRLPRRKATPINLLKETPFQPRERRGKKTEVRKQEAASAAEPKRKSA